MLRIQKFDNDLMQSNCYLLWGDNMHHCVIIDPASRLSINEIRFIETHQLILDYIILSHEHSDHTWGVNALLEKYPNAQVIANEICALELPNASQSYFQFYYDDPEYSYHVKRVDIMTEQIDNCLLWGGIKFEFLHTPGHSRGSMCIKVENKLFSGDTLMMSKPFLNKRDGNRKDYQKSLEKLRTWVDGNTEVYPGHGEGFRVGEWK